MKLFASFLLTGYTSCSFSPADLTIITQPFQNTQLIDVDSDLVLLCNFKLYDEQQFAMTASLFIPSARTRESQSAFHLKGTLKFVQMHQFVAASNGRINIYFMSDRTNKARDTFTLE